MSKRIKQAVMVALRVLFAVAGLSFIAYSIDWYDQVVVPAGTPLGQTSERDAKEPTALRIIDGQITRDGPVGMLTLQGVTPGDNITVNAADMGLNDDQPHYKPGVFTMLRYADKLQLLMGLALVSLVFPIQMVRWWVLMQARRLEVPMLRAGRLMMIGCFFNYCMPGTTGGDVVKAFYAARSSHRRADAVMTVVVDRIAGLLGLVLFGGLIGLTMLEDPVARKVTLYVWLGLAAFIAGASAYFSGRLRRALGVDWLLSKLPAGRLIGVVDAAAVAYRHHLGAVLIAVLISIVVHMLLTVATASAGYALGMDRPWLLMLTVIPVLFLAASVPLTFQGLGVMEAVAMALLLDPPAATANHLVGMLLLCRLYQMVYSLLGAVCLLGSDVQVKDMQTETLDVEAPAGS